MKNKYLITIFLVILQEAIAGPKEIPSMARTEEGKRKFAEVTQLTSTQNIPGLIKALPELEKIWIDDPLGYLQAVSSTILALSQSTDLNAVDSIKTALPKILGKRCPDDTQIASFYFGLKSNIIGYLGRCLTPSEHQQLLLINADFISKIRSKIELKYRNRAVKNPGQEILEAAGVKKIDSLPTFSQKEEVRKAILKNIEDEKTDRLQESLSILDRNMTNMLIRSSSSMGLSKVAKAKFLGDLIRHANLNIEEQNRLLHPKE